MHATRPHARPTRYRTDAQAPSPRTRRAERSPVAIPDGTERPPAKRSRSIRLEVARSKQDAVGRHCASEAESSGKVLVTSGLYYEVPAFYTR